MQLKNSSRAAKLLAHSATTNKGTVGLIMGLSGKKEQVDGRVNDIDMVISRYILLS